MPLGMVDADHVCPPSVVQDAAPSNGPKDDVEPTATQALLLPHDSELICAEPDRRPARGPRASLVRRRRSTPGRRRPSRRRRTSRRRPRRRCRRSARCGECSRCHHRSACGRCGRRHRRPRSGGRRGTRRPGADRGRSSAASTAAGEAVGVRGAAVDRVGRVGWASAAGATPTTIATIDTSPITRTERRDHPRSSDGHPPAPACERSACLHRRTDRRVVHSAAEGERTERSRRRGPSSSRPARSRRCAARPRPSPAGTWH